MNEPGPLRARLTRWVALLALAVGLGAAILRYAEVARLDAEGIDEAFHASADRRLELALQEFHPLYAALRERVSRNGCVILFAKPDARSEICLWGLRSALFPVRFEIFDALVRLSLEGQLELCDEFWLVEVDAFDPPAPRAVFLPLVGKEPELAADGFRLWRARRLGP